MPAPSRKLVFQALANSGHTYSVYVDDGRFYFRNSRLGKLYPFAGFDTEDWVRSWAGGLAPPYDKTTSFAEACIIWESLNNEQCIRDAPE
jgi:hypothetical protein